MSSNLRRVVESVLRKRGAVDGLTGVLLFEDTLEVCGGQWLWKQLLIELIDLTSSGRVNCDKIKLAAFDWSCREYSQLFSTSKIPLPINILDCSLDPLEWRRDGGGDSRSSSTPPNTIFVSVRDNLKALQDQLCSGETSQNVVVVVDSLTMLSMRFDDNMVLSFLNDISRSPCVAGILLRIHSDVHEPHIVRSLEYMSSAFIQLNAPNDLHQELAQTLVGHKSHGAMDIRQKTHTGKVSVVHEWYRIDGNGGVLFFAPPTDMQLNAQELVAAKVKGNAKGKDEMGSTLEEDLMKAMEGGMKLTLTDKERQAKAGVVLPYEKVQEQAEDAAGQKLGEILYYRDSEEDFDSDEDPDDDLDI